MIQVKKKPCDGEDCNGALQVIWKNIVEDGQRKRFCKSCYFKKKPTTKLKRTPLPKQTTPIAPRSDKRAKQERVYAVLRKSFLERHPICQMQIPGVCTGKSQELHHMAGRIGNLLLDEQYFKAGCHSCHVYVETHPEEAKALGLSETRIDK